MEHINVAVYSFEWLRDRMVSSPFEIWVGTGERSVSTEIDPGGTLVKSNVLQQQ